MPVYQATTKANGQTINTDIEADNKDKALVFLDAVSVGRVVELKEYLFEDNTTEYNASDTGRYASVKIYFDMLPTITVKIPHLKITKTVNDIKIYFKNIYHNAKKIDVNITDKI